EILKISKDLELKAGTMHSILSDVPEPDSWISTIRWIACMEMDRDTLMETTMAILERSQPQRVTLIALQQYVGVLTVADITEMIDQLVERAGAWHTPPTGSPSRPCGSYLIRSHIGRRPKR
ncbi:MAG: hypothetical protein GY696_01980, partial [Gammaproteobacteria bacterium]|nr:hypothetical protein [Gammaproteobacteria bacterium]